MTQLRIDRREHSRSSYIRDGTRIPSSHVKRTVYLARDGGQKGRSEKMLPPSKDKNVGTLGKGFYQKSETTRRRILAERTKKVGERVTQGQSQRIAILQRRTNPSIARKAESDRKWISKNFEGKKMITPLERRH